MSSPVLLLLGDFSERREVIDRAAGEFGWVTVTAWTYEEVVSLCERAQVVGILFHALENGDGSTLSRPWSNGVRVRPIACFSPAVQFTYHDLERLGAYHAILEPVSFKEVRLSLGFLAQAVARDTEQHRDRVLPKAVASRQLQNAAEFAPAGAAA